MKTLKMNSRADYGNWVPAAMMKTLWMATAALCIITILLFVFLKTPIPGIIAAIAAFLGLCMTLYMQRCRKLFDFNGGNVMGDIHQFLVDHFPWKEASGKDGSGRILDIGCGAGALTNRVALTFPKAELIGIDYWGAEWSYAKEQCEHNAELEGVSNRVRFQKATRQNLISRMDILTEQSVILYFTR